MGSAEIKEIESSDFDAWMPLWEGYQQFYKVEVPKVVTRRTWARFPDPSEPMRAVIAIVQNRVLGFAHSIYHRSTWTAEDYCYLQGLFVEAGARGFGVGRWLIEHAYADACRRRAPRVYWSTHETNQSAKELYDRVADRSGFIIYRKTLD